MVMIRMGVVQELVKAGKPKTAQELSVECGGEEMLIGAFYRHFGWACLWKC